MLDFSVTFIITIVNITILYFILRKILFKPVTKFMADRTQRVQDSLEQASQDKVTAQQLLVEYQGKLKNADADAEEIRKAAQKQAKTEAAQILAEGRAAADALIAAGRKQLDGERQAMHTCFKLEAAALVMAASARLVQREITGDDNRRFAAMLLDELAAQKGSG